MVFGVQRLLLVEAGEALTAHCGDLADAQEEPLAKIELFLPAARPEVFPWAQLLWQDIVFPEMFGCL